MEMKMECKNIVGKTFNQETETEKKKGLQSRDLGTDIAFQEMGMDEGSENSGVWVKEIMPEEEGQEKADEPESRIAVEGVIEEENNHNVGGCNRNMAPVDDVCPICFDKFTIPCRTNCGHWFCASCILEFWMYRSSIQLCKCPLCCCLIVNLTPQMSQIICSADDVADVLKKVQQYNGLSSGGMHGFLQKALALPLFMRRIFRNLVDPDGLRCVYYFMRLLGLLLALLYEMGEFEFIAMGGFGIKRSFDIGASILVCTLLLVGTGYRFVLRSRERRLAVLQTWNIWLLLHGMRGLSYICQSTFGSS